MAHNKLLGLVVIVFCSLVIGNCLTTDSQDQETLRDVVSNSDGVTKGSLQSSTMYDVTKETQRMPRDQAKNGNDDRQKRIFDKTDKTVYRERDQDVTEVISDDSLLAPDSNNIVTDVLGNFRSFRKFKKLANKWTKTKFNTALKELGIFTIKGLEVVRVTKDKIEKLKRKKDHMMTIRARHPRKRRGKKNPKKKANKPLKPLQKRGAGYDLCAEYVDTLFVLAHADSQTAYKIESVRCEGKCNSTALNTVLGTCNLATKAMVVYIINRNGSFLPKTIEPGCACECIPYDK